MIMCAYHHCSIDLCGCDADEQYRRAQAGPDEPKYKALYTELKEERDRPAALTASKAPTLLMRFAVSGEYSAAEEAIFEAAAVEIRKLTVRAQAAEQALSDLKREVLEKVGPFARLGELIGQYQDYRKGRGLVPAEVNSFGEAFRALSTLHDKLSSDVFPESPSGDVSTHAAGEGGGSANPSARGEL